HERLLLPMRGLGLLEGQAGGEPARRAVARAARRDDSQLRGGVGTRRDGGLSARRESSRLHRGLLPVRGAASQGSYPGSPRARGLVAARGQQRRSGGLTELVPLPFVHMEAPMWLRGRARSGPTFGETLLVDAVARLALHPWITNVQVSWVKLGAEGVTAALRAGVNDLGGTLMNESISRSAGAQHGQEFPPERMEDLIRSLGRVPRQRTTLYGDAP